MNLQIILNTFYQNKVSSMKQAELRGMFRKASNSACKSTIVVSPDTLLPSPTFLGMRTPENTEEVPNYPEPADGGDIQMKYSSDKLCSPST
jgi:hypothetical protein